MRAAQSTMASIKMTKKMAKASYTMRAATSTMASGKMTKNMAKASNTLRAASRILKASGKMVNLLSDDSVYEPKQSES